MYARSTFTDLRRQVLGDLGAGIPGLDPYQRRSVAYVLGTIFAKAQDAQFGYLDWQARQAVPFTAAGEYLLGWAGLRGLDFTPAAKASGSVIFAGNPGATVYSALQVRRNDGVLYTLPQGDVMGPDGTVTLTVKAQVAGANGNCDPDTPLELVSTLAGISGTAHVSDAGIGGGSDLETNDNLRGRMLAAYRAPPQGGDLDDYVAWARQVPGVTRAWCYGGAGGGAVVVYFMLDDARPETHGLPIGSSGVSQLESRGAPVASGDQLGVADYIFTRRAATALVFACAPIAQPLDLVLREVPADDTVRAAIQAAYVGFLRREASPGGVVLPDLSIGGVVRRAHLDAAIAAVPGLDHYVIDTPSADVIAPLGTITTPGNVVFD